MLPSTYPLNLEKVLSLIKYFMITTCLLYTSDAADERSSVDLGGRRIIKKKKRKINSGSDEINKKSKTQKSTTKVSG